MPRVRHYGPVAGVAVGMEFSTRADIAKAGVHAPLQAGISGGLDGADSIVVSGGYEDDQDFGDEIIYTGQGGNDSDTGRQVADQKWNRGNAGLVRSCLEGNPVRVVRGALKGDTYAPKTGYRYDGLYFVAAYWEEVGRSGYRICRFKLVRDDPGPRPWEPKPAGTPPTPAPRQQSTIQRIVRNTAVSTKVKELHDYTCQVCGTRLDTPGGPYAEGAHIRALGTPHNGPDVEENILCLCPNHHVLFDGGGLFIHDDLRIEGHPGLLRTAQSHHIDRKQLAYHREHAAKST